MISHKTYTSPILVLWDLIECRFVQKLWISRRIGITCAASTFLVRLLLTRAACAVLTIAYSCTRTIWVVPFASALALNFPWSRPYSQLELGAYTYPTWAWLNSYPHRTGKSISHSFQQSCKKQNRGERTWFAIQLGSWILVNLSAYSLVFKVWTY